MLSSLYQYLLYLLLLKHLFVARLSQTGFWFCFRVASLPVVCRNWKKPQNASQLKHDTNKFLFSGLATSAIVLIVQKELFSQQKPSFITERRTKDPSSSIRGPERLMEEFLQFADEYDKSEQVYLFGCTGKVSSFHDVGLIYIRS